MKINNENRLDCRILLVDDLPDQQRLVSFYLKQAGANVFFADNGEIGVNLALEARDHGLPFDVILIDIQMPVIDGNKATKTLREKDYTAPIIALTAYTDQYDRETCIAAGCDDYMSKPVDPNKLVDLVERYSLEYRKSQNQAVCE